MDEITEFDEQLNKNNSLSIIRSKIWEYLKGDESLGVVDAYIFSAYKNNYATVDEVEALWKELKADYRKFYFENSFVTANLRKPE